MKHTTRYTEAQLIEAVAKSKSTANVCRILGLVPVGGNYKTINRKINILKINTDHFTRQGWNKGMRFPNKKGIPLSKILVKHSSYTNSMRLKKRLLDARLLKPVCNRCGNTHWQNEIIPLELHHKNGNKFDHRLKNIELLCPNCHAFTDTYRGRNV